MPVVTHVAAHPDELVAELCRELARPGADPFATELVAVPTRGVERWLTQEIASRLATMGVGDGICANVDFPAPSRLVRSVFDTVPDLAAAATAWEGNGLVAHVLAAIDEHLDEPWLAVVRRHVEAGTVASNRYSAATKIARLFAAYARRRPAMIRAWAAGADTGSNGVSLPESDTWQPELWRRVREAVGVAALPELLPEALQPVIAGDVDLALPQRLAVYGLTAIDPLDLDVLVALGAHRDVHLFLLHPSPALWEESAAVLGDRPPDRRNDDQTRTIPAHPLLRSWAQDSRELQIVLADRGLTANPSVHGEPVPGEGSSTVLGSLQQNILANRVVPVARIDGDRSIQVHACHGARRQVEVLRDAILHVLAADPTLESRDVVIMTPDLVTFAPLLEAAFPATHIDEPSPDDASGDPADDGLPDLRVRIADRSPATTNPLVRFVTTVLDLAGSRLEATAVRDLVTSAVVQQRLGFDADTAGQIVAVIDDTNVAWGLDGTDREHWNAGNDEQRTWRRGLDMALTGVFYADSPVRTVADIAPLQGVEGQDANPVGLLAAIMDRIAAIRLRLGGPMPRSQWAAAIADAVRMLGRPAWGDDWQLDQLDRLLTETFPTATSHTVTGAVDPLLHLHEAGRAVSVWTDDRPSPLHFRSGDVTVCTLVPMRSVPYRVVCLLGMDDDRFPRASRSDGDDLLLNDEVIGDPDRGAQDRQLLLDAVMAAGDHLIVTYSGRDELTNAELPPAVPIAELIDTVSDMTGSSAAGVVRHPLQPFSETNFVPDQLGVTGSWGFDPTQLRGAIAARYREFDTPVAAGPVAWPDRPDDDDPLALDDLLSFLIHPVRRFVRTRLGFNIPSPGETPDDTLPAEIDALGKWGITERLLTGLLAGHDIDRLTARERRSDTLPAGRLGDHDLQDAVDAAMRLRAAAATVGYDPARRRPYSGMVTVNGRHIEGSVSADAERSQVVAITASRLKAKQRIRAYGHLVFLSAFVPEVAWTSVLVGKRQYGPEYLAVTMGPIGDDPGHRSALAIDQLGELVALYDEGHRRPIPMPCETSYAWQRKVGNNRDGAYKDAKERWETDKFSPEADDPAHLLALPGTNSFDALLAAGFEDFCARLWRPIIPMSREANL